MSLRSTALQAPLKPAALISIAGLALALTASAACGDDKAGDTGDGSDTADTATAGDSNATDTGGAPDATGPDTATPCDPVAQTGCDAQKNCTFVAAEESPTCEPAGPVPPEEECGSEARCQVGVCLSLNQTGSRCYQFCDDDGDCGGDTGSCLTLSNAAFHICKIDGIYQNCNLLTQDCTETGKACYAVANEDDPICLTVGTKAVGEACDKASDCVKGVACVNDMCRTLCDPAADPDPCGEAFQCNEFFANAGYCEPK